MPVYNYADQFSNHLRELYGHELTSIDLYNSNQDIQIKNGKNLKIPRLQVSGYKDHSRSSLGFNTGRADNDYQIVTLDHDRDIEFPLDPMDVDETNLVVSIANIQKRFDKTQAIPEQDCYTYSKLYSEFVRAGGKVDNTVLSASNILDKLDADLSEFEDAGVPLDRVILYCTTTFKNFLKKSPQITRTLSVGAAGRIDRRILGVDDIKKMVTVPSARFKTAFDFTEGYKSAVSGKQINYILIDPEAQVSRVKYSYIKVFTPGHDSRTSDKYLYQNRKYNGTFAIDELITTGCIINADAAVEQVEGENQDESNKG